ncbi:MAG: dicarboxylate/amino acid:cation symporter [Coriobacteriales bacterium]|nr:dicarboxylate/amino acid:cation symporter [Coriobacteriales bacterium]
MEGNETKAGAASAASQIKSLGVTTWILIALVAGILLGIILNAAFPKAEWADTWVFQTLIGGSATIDGTTSTYYGILYFFGQAFVRLMQMLVVPLVFCSIVCGAASMSDPKLLGKVGLGTILMYLFTTAIAIILAILLAQGIKPGIGLDMNAVVEGAYTPKTADSFGQVMLNIIPTNIVSAMSSGTMLQIIFFALILGFLLGNLGKKVATVNRFFVQFNAVMMRMVSLVLKCAPVGVFCLIAASFYNLGFDGILPMLKFIGTVYLGLVIQLFLTYMIIITVFARVNPIHFLKKIVPVMIFAFSTSSSNATIPLNMENLKTRMGVDNKVASFTIPLGATINMDGTAIMQGAAVIFAAQAFGIDLNLTALLTVVITAVAASIGTAGVPGVGTIMTAMVFDAVGLPVEGISMIMGVDRILDMGRTAINVTGDAAVSICMAKMVNMLDEDVYNDDSIQAVDLAALEATHPHEPTDYDDYEGEPTEIGELGDPDKFENIEVPK